MVQAYSSRGSKRNLWRHQMRILVYGLIVTCVLYGDSLLNVAEAEWYLSGYGGGVFPGSLSTVTITKNFGRFGATSAARTSDLDLEQDVVLGAKTGYFSEDRK